VHTLPTTYNSRTRQSQIYRAILTTNLKKCNNHLTTRKTHFNKLKAPRKQTSPKLDVFCSAPTSQQSKSLQLQCSTYYRRVDCGAISQLHGKTARIYWTSRSQPFLARGPLPSPSPSRGPHFLLRKKRSKLPSRVSMGHSPSCKRFLDILYAILCNFMRVLVHSGS